MEGVVVPLGDTYKLTDDGCAGSGRCGDGGVCLFPRAHSAERPIR